MTTATEINELLQRTTLPPALIRQLVGGAPSLWLATNTAPTLAGDLVLCHPALGPAEVRARAAAFADGECWRLTVMAHDRPGLLADTAAVLASSAMSIVAAGVGTWPALELALESLAIRGPLPSKLDWQELAERLRLIDVGQRPTVAFVPAGTVTLDVSTDEERWLLHVEAEDQVGLLWCICRGLADLGLGIQAAHVAGRDGVADDLFVLDGEPDVDALRRRLTPPD